jgi:hypothetical protein
MGHALCQRPDLLGIQGGGFLAQQGIVTALMKPHHVVQACLWLDTACIAALCSRLVDL